MLATICQNLFLTSDIFCPLLVCMMFSAVIHYSIASNDKAPNQNQNPPTKGQSMTTTTISEQIFATQSLVYGYMLKLTKNPNDAHDASMNGILKAIDNADKYDGSSKVSTWVCTIAYRLWLDTIRSHSNSKTTYTGDAVFLENVGGFYNQVFDTADTSTVWEHAQAILNEKQFACIKLHSEGLKYKEIAERLSIPIGSVMSAISGAKKKLRDNASFKATFGDLV